MLLFLMCFFLLGGVTEVQGASPVIFFTGTSASTMTPASGPLKISVVASDPDGVSDLIGGVVVDNTGITYGILSAVSDEGAYDFTIDWHELNRLSPIKFNSPGTGKDFIIRLYDQAGHFSESVIKVTLACAKTVLSACDGFCYNLSFDKKNCGTCGNSIDRYIDPNSWDYSEQSVCRPDGLKARVEFRIHQNATCESKCKEIGLRCTGFLPTPNPYAEEMQEEGSIFDDCAPGGCFGASWWNGHDKSIPLESCEKVSPNGKTTTCYCSE